MGEKKACDDCGHDWGSHGLFTFSPLEGGVMLCPECDCINTWTPHLRRSQPPERPPIEKVADLLHKIEATADKPAGWANQMVEKLYG